MFSRKTKSKILKYKTHTGEKPYECDVCNQRFTQAGNLMAHKRTHTGEKPYGCDVCNKRFTQTSHLVRHKRIHTGEKPYGCDVCNKRFTQASHLVTHKRTHTGEKPYECDVCNAKFSTSSNLTTHKWKEHKQSKGFNLSSELKARKPTGITYMCCICDEEFEIPSALENHMVGH